MLATGTGPTLEGAAHGQKRSEGANSPYDRAAVRRVRYRADHRERVLRQAAHDPGRFHVDGHGARGRKRLSVARPDITRGRDERPGEHAEAGAAELSGKEGHRGQAPRL